MGERKEDMFIQDDYESSDSSTELELVIDKNQPVEKRSKEDGMINGQNIFEFDLNSLDEKPWNKPGADVTDYFNYGFNETTWKEYCNMQWNRSNHNQKNNKYKRRDDFDTKHGRYDNDQNRGRRYNRG
ncbi:Pre-mRNA polyadenylation factor fip1 [Nosema granulosis]|uniref:Pre-mRNA polyadenylation factor fip1 n=1 Tax=Nosema granulosis TaxID=83296 RepID=A0A9P6L0A4_9MICR|nr:Pre-mRNA polyadenylation factor fip1 [Nosema granulosis]